MGGSRRLMQEGIGGMRAISRVSKILDHVLAWNDAESGMDEIGEGELIVPGVVVADFVNAFNGGCEEPFFLVVVGEEQFIVFFQFGQDFAIKVEVFPDTAPRRPAPQGAGDSGEHVAVTAVDGAARHVQGGNDADPLVITVFSKQFLRERKEGGIDETVVLQDDSFRLMFEKP